MNDADQARILVIDDDRFFRDLLRATPETASIPVVFSSSRKDTDTMTEAEKLGAAAYLVKPFQSEQLLEIVARCLAQGKHRKRKANPEE